jgi:hypothetical protein
VTLLLTVTLFLLVEGSTSVILVTLRALSGDRPLNRRHTQFDEEIGWVGLPNVAVKDMYGPGKFFRTNSMGFRNDRDFSPGVPDDRARLVCSGDSFTMGFGVDNDHAWCKLLESVDGRIESVNLGQGGYGIDQSYLWYERNMNRLGHDIHVFAFITEDFRRMQSPTFGERGKPLLALEGDRLVNKNRPVPEPSFINRFADARRAAADLRSVTLLKAIIPRRGPSPGSALEAEVRRIAETQRVAARIFEDLQGSSKATHSTLILIYLPVREDFVSPDSEPWRRFLRDEASQHDLLFVDLVDDFRRAPLEEVEAMFDDTHNHYTEAGNLYITSLLYKKLLAIPEVEQKFRQRAVAAGGTQNNVGATTR